MDAWINLFPPGSKDADHCPSQLRMIHAEEGILS